MKCKRILSMLLTLCMVMSLFAGTTVTASAASVTTRTRPLDVTSNITDTNGNSITPTTDSEGTSTYSCESEGWSYRFNSSKQIDELTLSGVNFDIENTDASWAIMAPGKVILADGTENRVSTVSSNKLVAAINTPEITGSGSLTVSATSTSTESGASCYGIYSMKDLTLDQCSIVVDGVKCSNGSATGIFAKLPKSLTIKANTANNNKITIKNVQGTTTKALGAQKIVAEGAFVSGAEGTFTSGRTKTISFKDPKVPVIVSFVELPPEPEAATFTDGLGKTDCKFDTYTKDAKNEKGYTFAGWFGDDGNELMSAGAAVAGTTYTAKWTKNGKTVRTTVLDLSTINTNQSNAEEGWSWDVASQTLTLNGVTIDAQLDKNAGAAIGASGNVNIITAEGTENFVYSHSEKKVSTAIYVEGNLTISGKGKLTVTGETAGIDTEGDIHINAPLSASAISSASEAAAIRITSEERREITIAPSLTIKQPEGGSIGKDEMCILGKEGTPAKEVVIGAAAPTFTDGFGNTIENAASYKKGTTTNDKGYTFAGWFNGETELESTEAAVPGTTYTAKWTKNGKTVRTTALDLTKIGEDNTFGATLTGGVYTNADEGWSWNPGTKTLTLSGATMDIQLDSGSGIYLPDGATVATAENTENAVSVRTANSEHRSGCAIGGSGDLTISGKGILQVVGVNAGISTGGNITINAPIDVSITGTGDDTAAIYIESEREHRITIHDALDILKPTDGVIGLKGKCITESDGTTPARNVVIGVAKKYTVTYNTNGGTLPEHTATTNSSGKLTSLPNPTYAGYVFKGWYDAVTGGNRITTDTVFTQNTTIYAQWIKAYSVSGKVVNEADSSAVDGATVKIGDITTTTGADGSFTLPGIPVGDNNIVVTTKDGSKTVTKLVKIENKDVSGIKVVIPTGNVSSVVETTGLTTPKVLVGGLDDVAKEKEETGKSVVVKLTVEQKADKDVNETVKNAINVMASKKQLEYLDMAVNQTVDGAASSPISDTGKVLEIIVPYDMTGKCNIAVYRHHVNQVQPFGKLEKRPTSSYQDGTFFVGNDFIVIYTQKFSTYAIGYNTQSGGGSGSGGSSSGGGSSSSSGGSSSGNSSTISTPSAKNGTVSVSPKSASKGTTVTVTVTPDKGYVLETLTVTDASGKKLDLKNLGSGKYSFTMPASKVEVKATFMEDNTMLNYFVDVPASAYYYDAVLWAAEQGITGGTDATHFSPDGVCTRAQAVTFLWRAAGSPAPSTTAMPFTDVAADSYYYNAVLWAMENGITVGTSSTTFSPDLKCSRAHIMTFLWRSEKSPAAGSVNPFTDVSADAYYADAVLWAVKESVTNGTSSATFSPDADCTRAQIVTFIWRTLAR